MTVQQPKCFPLAVGCLPADHLSTVVNVHASLREMWDDHVGMKDNLISRSVHITIALFHDRLQDDLTDCWKASGGRSTCFLEAGVPKKRPVAAIPLGDGPGNYPAL